MLKPEFIKALETKIGLEEGKLSDAITNESEVDLELPDITVYTPDALSSFKQNLINDSRKGIVEVEYKKAAKEQGIDLPEAKRNAAGFLEAITEKVRKDLKIEPDKKIEQIQKEAKVKIEEAINRAEAKQKEIEQLQTQIFSTEVKSKAISSLKSDTVIPKEDVFALFTMRKAQPVKTEDGVIAAKDLVTGQIIKNEKLEPIPFTDIFKEFTDKHYAKKGGASGGSKGGRKDKDGALIFKTYAEWEAHFADDMTTDEANKSLTASAKLPTFKIK